MGDSSDASDGDVWATDFGDRRVLSTKDEVKVLIAQKNHDAQHTVGRPSLPAA